MLCKRVLRDDQILQLELELTGCCNLNCILCANRMQGIEHVKKQNIMPLKKWKNILDKYVNVNLVTLAGIVSEPTIYPELFGLLDYLVSRKINIELYTNGNLHDNEWWNELQKHLTKNDKVIFTICGSTQELHEKYRVGSNLQRILYHADSFRKNNLNHNDWIQHIKFKYNEDDFNLNMKSIINKFNNKVLINSLQYNERFGFNLEKYGFTIPGDLGKKYKMIMNDGLSRKSKNAKFEIECKSYIDKFLSIDQFGNAYPCFIYKFYSHDAFNNDYSNIFKYKYDFCYECEKHTLKMLKLFNLERVI